MLRFVSMSRRTADPTSRVRQHIRRFQDGTHPANGATRRGRYPMTGHPTLLWLSLCALSGCGLDSTDNLTLGPTAAVPQYTVNLKTTVGGLFVTAENGGGGDVNANRAAALGWETFTFYDLNGGGLQHGDLVNIGTS